MKKSLLFLLLLQVIGYYAHSQSTSQKIGNNPTVKDPSALLELESTNKGTLFTRVILTSTTSPAPILSPANGLTVFNTATVAGTNGVTPGYYFWSTASSKWIRLLDDATGWLLTGNTGTNPTNNYLGTSDAQDLSIRTNGTEKIRVTSAGDVGIGINVPKFKLQTQINGTIPTYTAFMRPIGGIGISANGATVNNPFEAHLGWVRNSSQIGVLLLQGVEENIAWRNIAMARDGGNVGIGTDNPVTKLDVSGTTRTIGFNMPTSAAAGAVLTSDASGNGTWQTSAIANVIGVVTGAGIDIPYTTTQYLYTGDYIILPPGKYAVNVSMLLTVQSGGVTFVAPANSSFWLRSTFADGFTFPNQSFDIQGGHLASGLLPGSSFFGLINGTIIINNTSGAAKAYYYTAGNCATYNTTQTISGFGSSANFENRIIAYKIN